MLSLPEDGLVPLGLWLALVLGIWLICVCWRFLTQLFARVTRIFNGQPGPELPPAFTLMPPFSKNDNHV